MRKTSATARESNLLQRRPTTGNFAFFRVWASAKIAAKTNTR
jgi:hypothetical protein